jgi:hypothetical protein
LVGALGALAGALLPRVALPRLAYARRPPVRYTAAPVVVQPESLPGEGHAQAPVPGEISLDEPEEVATEPAPTAADAAPVAPTAPTAPTAPGVVAHRAHPRAPRLPSILTRRAGRWQLDLREIGRPRQVLAGVRVAPTGGESAGDGYRLLSSDRLGLLSAAGVRPGDVLVAVNGAPLRNPDDALEVLARSRRETHFAFRFRRGSGSYTVPVDILRRSETADAR